MVLLSVCILTVGAADGTHGADLQANTQQLREAARQQPHNPLAHVQLALALHELNHQVPDGGSRVPEAEREYRSGLSLLQGRFISCFVYLMKHTDYNHPSNLHDRPCA